MGFSLMSQTKQWKRVSLMEADGVRSLWNGQQTLV